MRGRIFGIKKSYILTTALVLLVALFVAFTLLTTLVYQLYYLWFFIFCLCCGIYQFLKGILFRFDSAFYFGVLLLSVGGVGFFTTFSQFAFYQSVLYILCFAIASYFTFVFFSQKFHLYLSLMLYFVTLFWFFVKIKVISIAIFVAILSASVLIFIVVYTLIIRFGKKTNQNI